ncbi:hypothetical protein pb186bvf_005569 [Paramecium bursaria]
MNLLKHIKLMRTINNSQPDIVFKPPPIDEVKKKVPLPKYIQTKSTSLGNIEIYRKKQKRRIKQKQTPSLPQKQENNYLDDIIQQEKERVKQQVTDADEELFLRQKYIVRQTRKKNINDQIEELKKLEEKLVGTVQGKHDSQYDDKLDSILKERRQQIYKKIYENVKKVSGVTLEQDLKQQQDQKILDQMKNLNPQIHKYLQEVQQQIQELQTIGSRKISPVLSPNQTPQKNITDFQQVFVRGNLSPQPNSSPRQSGRQSSKNTPRPFERSDSSRKTTRIVSSANKRSQRYPIQVKPVDQELLHILVAQWKNVNTKKKRIMTGRIYKSKLEELKYAKRRIILDKLLKWIKKMNRCKVTLQMMMNHKFPSQPFSINGSFVFLRFVKINNIKAVKELLRQDRNLLYEFNHLGQTCLHLASRHRHPDMVKFLLHMGADYEAQDFAKRSPLYYAIQSEDQESFRYLAKAGASPWGVETKDTWFSNALKQIKKVHAMMMISPPSIRKFLLENDINI